LRVFWGREGVPRGIFLRGVISSKI